MSFVPPVTKNSPTKNVFEEKKNAELNNYVRMKPTLYQNLHDYFTEYCEASTVHGIRYIGERGRFMIERLFWGVVVVLVCYFCIEMILEAYYKWKTSPVILSFATTETPISNIPFPAVTICPEIKSDPNVFNFSDAYIKRFFGQPLTSEEHKYFESLSLVCDGINVQFTKKVYENLNKTVDDSVLDDILQGYSFNDVLSIIYTNKGICYSFNILNVDELYTSKTKNNVLDISELMKQSTWSLEGGYSSNDNLLDMYPVRTFLSGINGAAVFYLYANNTHFDYMCGDSLQGFKVTLHHPTDQPDMDAYFQVPVDETVLVAVKPKMITVSDELKSYSPEIRHCYFVVERNLTFFKSYTQRNCLDECLANYTMKKCGCVAFYMPLEFLVSQTDTTNPSDASNCNCLPTCTSLQYEVEISQSNWNWRTPFSMMKQILDKYNALIYIEKTTHVSRLVVYYKEMQFLSSERHEVYGSLDFFSNTGGLLGLFIGFSVTSAIEILYFLTLRLVCNMKKFGRPFWAGQESA